MSNPLQNISRLPRRVRIIVRTMLATSLLWLTGILSVGAMVTSALAKTVGKEKPARVRQHHNHEKEFEEGLTIDKGTASWYGKQFHEHTTASGVPFDMNAMMAAHRTLPFGTKVLVTNLSNGRTCVVEITDRGPFVRSRIIDLSKAAAKALGFADKGTARVSLQVINPMFASYQQTPPRPAVTDALRYSLYAADALAAMK